MNASNEGERGQRVKIAPEVLILASKFDLSCDFVVAQLRRRKASYFRLNSEDLNGLRVVAVPEESSVFIHADRFDVELRPDTLEAVYFRRGVYPRESGTPQRSAQDQLARAHWSAFIRSFMMFDSCLWVNHPMATYKAEHKPVQLSVAHSLGFALPRTVITNDAAGIDLAAGDAQKVAVKGLDTVLVWQDGLETFGYTTLINTDLAKRSNLSPAPFIAQEALEEKLDLRVTVVGKHVFCASVTDEGSPIPGDWRLNKPRANFSTFELPLDIKRLCVELCNRLGLVFGAIDIALQNGVYYFLEVNPTGEWGWLVDQANLPIDHAIAEVLLEAQK